MAFILHAFNSFVKAPTFDIICAAVSGQRLLDRARSFDFAFGCMETEACDRSSSSVTLPRLIYVTYRGI